MAPNTGAGLASATAPADALTAATTGGWDGLQPGGATDPEAIGEVPRVGSAGVEKGSW
jgi:hypothetical protein